MKLKTLIVVFLSIFAVFTLPLSAQLRVPIECSFASGTALVGQHGRVIWNVGGSVVSSREGFLPLLRNRVDQIGSSVVTMGDNSTSFKVVVVPREVRVTASTEELPYRIELFDLSGRSRSVYESYESVVIFSATPNVYLMRIVGQQSNCQKKVVVYE